MSAFSDLADQKKTISKIPSCAIAAEEISKMIVAVGMARERAKGNASALHQILNSFPTYADYKSFHPRLAGSEILRDFGSLDVVETIKAQQFTDSQVELCFRAWKSQSLSIRSIKWLKVHEALEQIRTRAFTGPESLGKPAVVIPLADLLNTAPKSQFNTNWGIDDVAYTMTSRGSLANAELYDSYCSSCDNQKMLLIWGIYLEDNAMRGTLKCEHQGSDKALYNVTMAVLEPASQHNWTAPRCKAAVFESPQGPLRCSLARLAFEACAGKGIWPSNVSPHPSPSRHLMLHTSSNKVVKRRKHSKSLRKTDRVGKRRKHSKSLRSKHETIKQQAVMEAALLDQTYRH
jgi:hypothetical protein